MDIVRDPKIDWMGKKWYFIALSFVLAVTGALSIFGMNGLNLGVDFTGGTLVYVKFKEPPQMERIRSSLTRGGLNAQEVTRFDDPALNEVQIRMARVESEEVQDLTAESAQIFEALRQEYDPDQRDRLDLNNISQTRLSERLQELDPEGVRPDKSVSEFNQHYSALARRMIDFRTRQGGLIRSFSELEGEGISAPLLEALKEHFYLGSFTVISVESVGPKVGRELQERAQSAILFSLLGMLIYIAFRFRLIYGVAAILALFHDVFITLGLFSLTGKEISLTVIAALLTLVGYSINDTIVIFDRVRENLTLMRRADFYTVVNNSINQTLNRTIMTSGMTFLAVFALYWLGGEALNAFSFALVVGIIVGTYSSISIASPVVLWWQNYSDRRKSRA